MNNFFKISIIVVLITLIMSSCAIDKGFESLYNYNYFDAKEKFERVEERKIVPSTYGLSVIYQRNDNPFYNLDSALLKINDAYSNYSNLSESKREKYQKYDLDSLSILKQRNLISELFFKRAIETNSVYGFQDFISKNKWSPDVNLAINLRDSLFFFENHIKGGAKDYNHFMLTYPNSIYFEEANLLYNKAFYKESTANNDIEGYKRYLNEKPNGDFVVEAENGVFNLSIVQKTILEYNTFITDFPNNRNVHKAWWLLYDGYMQKEYSSTRISQFLLDYPNFPFKKQIEREMMLSNMAFYKYKFNNKWGFVSEDPLYSVNAKFDFVENFSEGLAVVTIEGETGYITKDGKLKIEPNFDDGYSFKNGFGVVEKNGFFGLINRSGEYVIEPTYDDLGNVNNGLLSFEKNNKSGFFNSKGEIKISPQYSNVSSFKNKLAIVEKNYNVGIIDTNGLSVIDLKYAAIKILDKAIFAVKNDTAWGLINSLNEINLPLEYDYLEKDNDSLILVEKDNQFNYWHIFKHNFISELWFKNYSEYKVLAKFTNGFAKVKTDQGYNFIDANGEFVFNTFYLNLGFYNKCIAFESTKGWGVLNEKGKIIVNPNYSLTHSFSKSIGIVEIDENKGVINAKGEIVLPIYFEELNLLNDTLVIVKKNNQYGILSNFNDTLVSIEYNFIEPISNSIVKIISESTLHYFNYKSNSWLKKEEE